MNENDKGAVASVDPLGATVDGEAYRNYQSRFQGLQDYTPLVPEGERYDPSVSSTSTGVEAFNDPIFIAELREYFARKGEYYDDPETLIEKFYSDQTWSNFNTIAMGRKNNEVNASSQRQLALMRRMKEVYDSTPMFWQEGGRGIGGLGQIVLAAAADPINLIGFGVGGAVAKGSVAAGKGAITAAAKGAGAAAAGEAVIGAGIGGAHDVGLQMIENKIMGTEGIDPLRAAQGAAFGAAGGAIGGGIFGGAGASFALRNATKRTKARLPGVEKLGYTAEDIELIAANPDTFDATIKDIVENQIKPDQWRAANAPAEPAAPVRPPEEAELQEVVADLGKAIDAREVDIEIARADGDAQLARQLEGEITKLKNTRDGVQKEIDDIVASRAAPDEEPDPSLSEREGSEGAGETKQKAPEPEDPEAAAQRAELVSQYREALNKARDSGTKEDFDEVDRLEQALMAARKAASKQGDDAAEQGTAAKAQEGEGEEEWDYWERDAAGEPDFFEASGRVEAPPGVDQKLWSSMLPEDRIDAARAAYDDQQFQAARAGARLSQAETDVLFGRQVETPESLRLPEEAAPEADADVEVELDASRFSAPMAARARSLGITNSDIKSVTGEAGNEKISAKQILDIWRAKSDLPEGVTIKTASAAEALQGYLNDGLLEPADLTPRTGSYSKKQIDTIANKKLEQLSADQVRSDGARPEYYSSDTQAQSFRKLLTKYGKDENWLTGLIKSEEGIADDVTSTLGKSKKYKGRVTKKTYNAVKARLEAEAGDTPSAQRAEETRQAKRDADRGTVAKVAREIATDDQLDAAFIAVGGKFGMNRTEIADMVNSVDESIAAAARKFLIDATDEATGVAAYNRIKADNTIDDMAEGQYDSEGVRIIMDNRGKKPQPRKLRPGGTLDQVLSAAKKEDGTYRTNVEISETTGLSLGTVTQYRHLLRDNGFDVGKGPTGQQLTDTGAKVAELRAQGLSHAEIGDKLGITAANSAVHLHKHLKRLKEPIIEEMADSWTPAETRRIRMLRDQAIKRRLEEAEIENDGPLGFDEEDALRRQITQDVYAQVKAERGQFVPKRSDTGVGPLARIQDGTGGDSTRGRETLGGKIPKRVARVAKKNPDIKAIGVDQAKIVASRNNKPIRFIADGNDRAQDAGRVQAGEILWYNPNEGPGKGVWSSEDMMMAKQNGRPAPVELDDVPVESTTLQTAKEISADYIAGKIDAAEFAKRMKSLDLNKVKAQETGVPNDLPPVTDDGRVLAIRSIPDSESGAVSVRVLSQKQINSNHGVAQLLGKSDISKFEIGYVERGSGSNSARALNTFEVYDPQSFRSSSYMTAREASDTFIPKNAATKWTSFRSRVEDLPTLGTGVNKEQFLNAFDVLGVKIAEGTATYRQLKSYVDQLEHSLHWDRDEAVVLSKNPEHNGDVQRISDVDTDDIDSPKLGEATRRKGTTPAYDFTDSMSKLYALIDDMVPAKLIRPDAPTLKESLNQLDSIAGSMTPREVTQLKSLLTRISQGPNAVEYNTGPGFEYTGARQGGYNQTTGKVGINTEIKGERWELPKSMIALHEIGHWLYDRGLTYAQKSQFWDQMGKYMNDEGLVDEAALARANPIDILPTVAMGVGGSNSIKKPAELFANQFMMWAARTQMEGADKLFTRYAETTSFWAKIAAYAKKIVDRFFYGKDVADDDLTDLFAALVPDPQDARILGQAPTKPKTKTGQVIYGRMFSIRDRHAQLDEAFQAQSPSAIIDAATDLANELYGLAGNSRSKDTPAFQVLNETFGAAREIYGKIYEILGYDETTKSMPVLSAGQQAARARKLEEVLQTSEDGVTFMLDGKIKYILDKARKKFNSLEGETELAIGRQFELKTASRQGKGFRKKQKMMTAARKSAEERLSKSRDDGMRLAGMLRKARPDGKSPDADSVEFQDTTDYKSLSDEALNAKMRDLGKKKDLVSQEKARRIAAELISRDNSNPVHDLIKTEVLTPDVGSAIGRELSATEGWSDDTLFPKAREAIQVVHSKMTHRNAARQDAMRTYHFRVANLVGEAEPGAGNGELSGILGISGARDFFRPIATNTVDYEAGKSVLPRVTIKKLADELIIRGVHKVEGVESTGDPTSLAQKVASHFTRSDDYMFTQMTPSEAAEALRLADAVAYVLNGQTNKAFRKEVPNLDRYQSVFRTEDPYEEMAMFDLNEMLAKLRDKAIDPADKFLMLNRAREDAAAAWSLSSDARKKEILQFLGQRWEVRGLDDAPRPFFVGTGPESARVPSIDGGPPPKQYDGIYGSGTKIYSSPYAAIDDSTLGFGRFDDIWPEFMREQGFTEQQMKLMSVKILGREQALRKAGQLRRRAYEAAEVGKRVKAAALHAKAKGYEDQIPTMTREISDGFDGGSLIEGGGKVPGLGKLGIDPQVYQPVYARISNPADFSEGRLFKTTRDAIDPYTGTKDWTELVYPVMTHMMRKYMGRKFTNAEQMTEALRKFNQRILARSGPRDLGETVPDSFPTSDSIPDIRKDVITGRELFLELAQFAGGGSHQKGAALVRMALKEKGYDAIIGTRVIDGEGTSAVTGDGRLARRGPNLSTETNFLMPLEAERQIKSVFAEKFDAHMPDGSRNWEEMAESARHLSPTLMKIMATKGRLEEADVQRLADEIGKAGGEPEVATGMAKMAEGKLPSPREQSSLRRMWRYVAGENTEVLRNNGLNWFADWIKPDRQSGTGHFERLAAATGRKFAPIYEALRSLPDTKKGVSKWMEEGPGGFQIRKVAPGVKAKQPASHAKIVAALRRSPGSDQEAALTPLERKAYDELRRMFKNQYEELKDAGTMVGHVKSYFPQVWNPEKIRQNYGDFVNKLAAYFMDESRVNSPEPMSLDQAINKARTVATRLQDEDGVALPPPGGGARSPQAEHVDYQRMIRLDDFQEHLGTLGNYLEDNLDAITAKYIDSSQRRIEFARQFGEQAHGFHDYMAIMTGADIGEEITHLLSSNKIKKKMSKQFNVEGEAPGTVIETTFEQRVRMPFATESGVRDEGLYELAVINARQAMKVHEENGPEAARAFLMSLQGDDVPKYAKDTYTKRVNAIVGGLTDRQKFGAPLKPNQADHAMKTMRVAQRRSPNTGGGWMHDASDTTSRFMRNLNSFTLLSYTALTSLGDLVLPIMKSGNMKAWADAVAKYAGDPDYRAMIKSSGVAIDNIVHERMTNLYGSSFGKNTVAFFNATGLSPWTKMNREISGAVGYEWLSTEFDRAMKHMVPGKDVRDQSAAFKKAYRVLRAYGLTDLLADNKRLKDYDLHETPAIAEAMVKFSNEAIFTPNPNDIPLWAQSPIGAMMFQLKSFPLMMSRYGKDVFMNAVSGGGIGGGRRIAPLALFATMGPAAGAGTLAVKDVAQMRSEEDDKLFRKRLLSDSMFKFFEEDSEADQFAGWFYEGFMMMGGFGLMAEMMHDSVAQADQGGAYGAMRFFGNVGGPSVGTAWGGFDAVSGAIDAAKGNDTNGKERAGARAIASRIPVVGGNRRAREAIVDTVAGPGRGEGGGDSGSGFGSDFGGDFGGEFGSEFGS